MPELVDERVDRITEEPNFVTMEETERFIYENSPFEIQLLEVPASQAQGGIPMVIEFEDVLDGAINDSQTTITVTHQADQFVDGDRIKIDNEEMDVDGTPVGDVVTVVRGANGTTPAAHSNGAEVRIKNSFTEIGSETPGNREYVVNYNTGWVRFNSAQAGCRIIPKYTARGSLVTVRRQMHMLYGDEEMPERAGAGMLVAQSGMVFFWNFDHWSPVAPIQEIDKTVNTFTDRSVVALTWSPIVTTSLYVPVGGGTIGAIARTAAKYTNTAGEAFEIRVKIDGNAGSSSGAVTPPSTNSVRRAQATHQHDVAGGGMFTVSVEVFANQLNDWEHQRTELLLHANPWEGS